MQAILQARWPDDHAALTLPHFTATTAHSLTSKGYKCLGDFVRAACADRAALTADLQTSLSQKHAADCLALLGRMPLVTMQVSPPRPHAPKDGAAAAAAAAGDDEEKPAGGGGGGGGRGRRAAANWDKEETAERLEVQVRASAFN